MTRNQKLEGALGGRNFYHSFPRPRPGETEEQIIEKGLLILKCIYEIGLIFAPEILEWKQPLVNGTTRTTLLRQKRLSLTELDRSEVARHSVNFGPFSLEFNIDTLRQLGALPVVYMPQQLKNHPALSSIGSSVVTQLLDIKYTINALHNLANVSNPDYIIAHSDNPDVTHVNEDYSITLDNIDDQKKVVATSRVPAKHVRDVINYIGFKNAPFDLMIGILTIVQNLFYPTDDEGHDDTLSYYRQREWRLIGGLHFNGIPHGRPLTDDEKQQVRSIDERFWSREIADKDGSFRRVDEAVVLDVAEGRSIKEFIMAVLVPPQAYDRARAIVGDIAVKVS